VDAKLIKKVGWWNFQRVEFRRVMNAAFCPLNLKNDVMDEFGTNRSFMSWHIAAL
jgi:hypothetical protein